MIDAEAHFGWAESVTRRYCRKFPKHVIIDDLIQEARLALFEAAGRYDPSLGCSYKTYARKRIIGSILDYLRSTDILRRRRKSNLMAIPFSALTSASYRIAFGEDNFDCPVHSKDDPTRAFDDKDEFEHMIREFDIRDQWVMRMRYQESFTLKEIGDVLDLSESRVSQMHSRCLKTMKANNEKRNQKEVA